MNFQSDTTNSFREICNRTNEKWKNFQNLLIFDQFLGYVFLDPGLEFGTIYALYPAERLGENSAQSCGQFSRKKQLSPKIVENGA